ncbi:MAG: protein kinase [Vicinamibacterales bacterium]
MALSPGARLGPYTVIAPLGEGGMGQVWRARDTKLDRDVALKILPEAFVHDADRVARFTREAKTLAALNHPRIAGIYGLEESGGVTALVMELVAGEDLSQVIARGPIPVDDALPIARQIADALDAAHEQGIVHRDLKPANIKVRTDGTVKMLDFGLAKASEPAAAAAAGATASPTILSPAMTQAGVILGTAAYMAPEQARGKPVDRRADVWAFGCVLYEMLTGRRAFQAEDVSLTLAEVMKAEPDWRALPALPPLVASFLRQCLKKDPTQRLADIRDMRLALDGAFELPAAASAAPDASRPTARPGVLLAVAAASTIGLAGLAVVHFRETPPVERPLHVAVPLGEQDRAVHVALSPDGRQLAVVIGPSNDHDLSIRALDSGEVRTLVGTRGARTPFWSPDGRSLGFFADDALKVIPAAGGPAEIVCRNVGRGFGATWSRQGVILFGSDRGLPLRRVEATGGECRDVGPGVAPAFLPDGERFLYTSTDRTAPGVYLATLAEPAGRRVLADDAAAAWAPPVDGGTIAHVLFLRDERLMAQPFDQTSWQPVGDPVPVAAPARLGSSDGAPAAVSAGGALVYLGGAAPNVRLTWVDRTQRTGRAITLPAGRVEAASLSPDGTQILFTLEAEGELPAAWVVDPDRGSTARISPIGQSGYSGGWSPDSARVSTFLTSSQGSGWFQKDLRTGALTALPSPDPPRPWRPADWSRDGRVFIYTQEDPTTRADLWWAPVESGTPDMTAAVQLLGSPADESEGQLSPDGTWLAYVTNESRDWRVHVRRFPAGASDVTVSGPGGRDPRWSADGRELYYVDFQPPNLGTLMAVAVDTDARTGIRIGTPRALTDAVAMPGVNPIANVFNITPHPDGRRFLVSVLASQGLPTVGLITHWQQTLAGQSPASGR